MEKLFLPSAGALYVYRPGKRQCVLNRAIEKLERSALPGYEYVTAPLYDKYRRNLTISTISQTGEILRAFLVFLQKTGRSGLELRVSAKEGIILKEASAPYNTLFDGEKCTLRPDNSYFIDLNGSNSG